MAETTTSSRAEQVRNRRTKTAPRSTARVRKVTKTPPIVTRARGVMPTRPMATSRTRRRYDVSLGSPGAELRLPTVPTMRWSWRIVSGVLVLALLGALYALWTMPTFRVSAAQINGLQRISERDVNLVLGLTDTPMFVLQPDVMQKNLIEAFPEFSSAEVQLIWPNTVSVSVIERVPVLAWTAGGQTVWVDAQGMSFPVRGEGDAASLVVVEAEGAPPAPTGGAAASGTASFAELAVVSPQASAWSHPLMSADLVSAVLLLRGFAPAGVTLLYDTEHGLGWSDPQGWQVYFGPDGTEMGQRLQVYQAMVAELNSQQIAPVLISVEHLHAPFYRMDQ